MLRFTLMRLTVLVLLVASLTVAACQEKELEIIEQSGLDQAPVIAQMIKSDAGYPEGTILLILTPKNAGHVRITRSNAKVLAVLDLARKWNEPTQQQSRKVPSINYIFDTPNDLVRHDLNPAKNLGKKIAVSEQEGQLKWFRYGRQNDFLIIEAAFNTDPLTVRKIKYRVIDNGYTIVTESGVYLKMK